MPFPMAIEAASSQPPWWAVTALAGCFTMLGVLLTLLYTYRRNKRLDARTWHGELHALASAFQDKFNEGRSYVDEDQPDPEASWKEYRRVRREAGDLARRFDMIGYADVGDLASKLVSELDTFASLKIEANIPGTATLEECENDPAFEAIIKRYFFLGVMIGQFNGLVASKLSA